VGDNRYLVGSQVSQARAQPERLQRARRAHTCGFKDRKTFSKTGKLQSKAETFVWEEWVWEEGKPVSAF